eukprot:3579437-Prymnesium_polylepis.1
MLLYGMADREDTRLTEGLEESSQRPGLSGYASKAALFLVEFTLQSLRNFLFIVSGFPEPPGRTSQFLARVGWCFFVLIILQTWVANLAAFLTDEKIKYPYETMEEAIVQGAF